MSLYIAGTDTVKGIANFDYKAPAFDTQRADMNAMAFGIEQERSFLESAGLFTAGVAVQTIDTFVSALPGVENDYIDNIAKTQAPDLARYMDENEGVIGLTSDILGSFVPGGLAIKAVRSAKVANMAAQGTLGAGAANFFSTGMSNSRLFKPVFDQARKLMKSGKAVHNLETAEDFVQLKKKFINQSVKDVLIENVAADVAIYTTMRNSDTMFSIVV